MKAYTEVAVIAAIRRQVEVSSLRVVGEVYGFSAPFLSDVLLGKRQVSVRLARAFGFSREVTKQVKFRKVG